MPTSAQFPMNIRDQKQRQPAGSPGRRSEITVELLRTPGGAQTLDFLGAESWSFWVRNLRGKTPCPTRCRAMVRCPTPWVGDCRFLHREAGRFENGPNTSATLRCAVRTFQAFSQGPFAGGLPKDAVRSTRTSCFTIAGCFGSAKSWLDHDCGPCRMNRIEPKN